MQQPSTKPTAPTPSSPAGKQPGQTAPVPLSPEQLQQAGGGLGSPKTNW
jgi:hypothetical protein